MVDITDPNVSADDVLDEIARRMGTRIVSRREVKPDPWLTHPDRDRLTFGYA